MDYLGSRWICDESNLVINFRNYFSKIARSISELAQFLWFSKQTIMNFRKKILNNL